MDDRRNQGASISTAREANWGKRRTLFISDADALSSNHGGESNANEAKGQPMLPHWSFRLVPAECRKLEVSSLVNPPAVQRRAAIKKPKPVLDRRAYRAGGGSGNPVMQCMPSREVSTQDSRGPHPRRRKTARRKPPEPLRLAPQWTADDGPRCGCSSIQAHA